MNRKRADKRITGQAGQGQMRHRVTAGRLGKLGLTLFALAGVFFSLFASVLDPVVWAAALDGGALLAAAEPELLFVPPHPASTSAAASTSAVRRLCFIVVLLCSQP